MNQAYYLFSKTRIISRVELSSLLKSLPYINWNLFPSLIRLQFAFCRTSLLHICRIIYVCFSPLSLRLLSSQVQAGPNLPWFY